MFCRGDVMSRFVILEGLERSGTGASRRFFLVSFPDPAHVPDPRRPPGRTAASVPRSGRCASCLSTPQCPSLSVCLSVHKRISPQKAEKATSSASKRVAERRIPPCLHHLTTVILIPFVISASIPRDAFRAGNINHNSRSDPTQLCKAFVDVAECPSRTPSRPPYQHFRSSTPGRAAPAQSFSQRTKEENLSARTGAPRIPLAAARAGAGRNNLGAAAAQCDTVLSNKV